MTATQAPTPGPMSGSVKGRLAAKPWRAGDSLPAVGSAVLVSGANCDVDSDQHRAFMWRTVVGYGAQDRFVCLQTGSCWPTVERLENCWFAEIPTPRLAPTAPVEASGAEVPEGMMTIADELEDKADELDQMDARGQIWGLGEVSDIMRRAAAALRPQPSGETRGPGGYLVKDFADGWYWTPNAAIECATGSPVWSVQNARYETKAEALIRPAPVASGGQHSSGEGLHTMTLSLTDTEMTALEALMASKDLSAPAVFRNSFRLYQAADAGLVTVNWPKDEAPVAETAGEAVAWDKLVAALADALDFIADMGTDLHHARVADWYPEGAHNAASQMSEDMRLAGNRCATYEPLVDLNEAIAASPVPAQEGGAK